MGFSNVTARGNHWYIFPIKSGPKGSVASRIPYQLRLFQITPLPTFSGKVTVGLFSSHSHYGCLCFF